MKKYNAYTMTMVEYGELLQKLSDNTLDVECDMDGWFYVEAEGYEYSNEEIFDMLNKELNETVVDAIVDTTEFKVAIICE